MKTITLKELNDAHAAKIEEATLSYDLGALETDEYQRRVRAINARYNELLERIPGP